MKTLERMCSECGDPISAARLKQKPDTTLCVGCKAELEKRPKTKVRENPAKVKQRRHKLPERLQDALRTLGRNKVIPLTWIADAGSDVADDLAKAEARVERFKEALAAKDSFDQAQLITIRAALRQTTAEVAAIVSKAMNAEAQKIRQGLSALNVELGNKKAVVSVRAKDRKFRFSIEERLNLDEVDAMISQATKK